MLRGRPLVVLKDMPGRTTTLERLLERLQARGLGDHAVRVCALAASVARRLGLDQGAVRDVARAALLHDVGKLAVPSSVLAKAQRLTPEEWAVVREHADLGARTLLLCPGLEHLAPSVLHAHERWDGTGYPAGLVGPTIPLAARIVAACDAWDAMRSDRAYRDALPFEEALDRLVWGAGSQFDTDVVAALVAHLRQAART